MTVTSRRVPRARVWQFAAGVALAMAMGTGAATPKFYPDDPISRIEDSQDASEVKERDIDLIIDTLENSFAWPGDSTPECPRAEREHGGRSSGLELVHESHRHPRHHHRGAA